MKVKAMRMNDFLDAASLSRVKAALVPYFQQIKEIEYLVEKAINYP